MRNAALAVLTLVFALLFTPLAQAQAPSFPMLILSLISLLYARQWKNQTNGEASAFLSILSVRQGDSGGYSCRVGTSQAQNTIIVHVLNGMYSHPALLRLRLAISTYRH
jgi:hypothetical protein